MSADDTAAALRSWARGNLTLEAAVELLITGVGGRLLGGPWIRRERGGGCWFDADLAAAESGVLSGGERRVLAVATSLASSDHPIDLGDTITGVDGTQLALVLEVMAHAGRAQTSDLAGPLVVSAQDSDTCVTNVR